ncbi:MAG: family 43 glycosylhydrolase, partial [Bacteroidales bacterium]|nr:family 43 glycosylhydrolase [Bacteroidales bacterium]
MIKISRKFLFVSLFASVVACVYGQTDDNDGLDALTRENQVTGVFSKASEKVYKNMPSELKNIKLEPSHIEIMSDDYNMGDWQESPSKIIYHEGYYHMWIIAIPQNGRKNPEGKSWTRYMKSKDGVLWLDQGLLPVGKKGTWDDVGRLAPDVVKYNGKFYMFYEPSTTNVEKYGQRRCGIACIMADQPEGPWRYATDELLLKPTIDDPHAFDHDFVANPRIEYLNGKWYMYYKARMKPGLRTENGVATSDNLLGPYTKYEGNPLMTGHSANLVKYKNGLIYMNYHHHAFYWTEDGFTFAEIKPFGGKTGMATEMNWSTFWLPNNPLYGGDASLPDNTEWWGVSSRWAYRDLG